MTNTENKLNGSRRKSLTTMMAALLAGSLVATAGSFAYAKTDGQAFDPAKFQQRIETRVDKALTGTDATADQKKQVAGILENAFKDMKPLHAQRVENRAEQMKVADQSSQRFTKALTDAGNVLSASQRQAFFKNWSQGRGENHGKRHG
jgi:membrane-bound lytic murein transglycosylase B